LSKRGNKLEVGQRMPKEEVIELYLSGLVNSYNSIIDRMGNSNGFCLFSTHLLGFLDSLPCLLPADNASYKSGAKLVANNRKEALCVGLDFKLQHQSKPSDDSSHIGERLLP